MPNRKFDPPGDPMAERNRVIRQRNLVLGGVLLFFVVLFFAITVVKMRHIKLPHKTLPASGAAPAAGGMNGQ
jgi:hypothetical protein